MRMRMGRLSESVLSHSFIWHGSALLCCVAKFLHVHELMVYLWRTALWFGICIWFGTAIAYCSKIPQIHDITILRLARPIGNECLPYTQLS